jgi:hypothetical protein
VVLEQFQATGNLEMQRAKDQANIASAAPPASSLGQTRIVIDFRSQKPHILIVL